MSYNDIQKKVRVLTLPDEYLFENGGRDYLLSKHGLSNDNILKSLNTFFLIHYKGYSYVCASDDLLFEAPIFEINSRDNISDAECQVHTCSHKRGGVGTPFWLRMVTTITKNNR